MERDGNLSVGKLVLFLDVLTIMYHVVRLCLLMCCGLGVLSCHGVYKILPLGSICRYLYTQVQYLAEFTMAGDLCIYSTFLHRERLYLYPYQLHNIPDKDLCLTGGSVFVRCALLPWPARCSCALMKQLNSVLLNVSKAS